MRVHTRAHTDNAHIHTSTNIAVCAKDPQLKHLDVINGFSKELCISCWSHQGLSYSQWKEAQAKSLPHTPLVPARRTDWLVQVTVRSMVCGILLTKGQWFLIFLLLLEKKLGEKWFTLHAHMSFPPAQQSRGQLCSQGPGHMLLRSLTLLSPGVKSWMSWPHSGFKFVPYVRGKSFKKEAICCLI